MSDFTDPYHFSTFISRNVENLARDVGMAMVTFQVEQNNLKADDTDVFQDKLMNRLRYQFLQWRRPIICSSRLHLTKEDNQLSYPSAKRQQL